MAHPRLGVRGTGPRGDRNGAAPTQVAETDGGAVEGGADASVQRRPLPAVPLHTRSRWILDAKEERLKLASANWYGAESPDFVVAGLDRAALETIARQIRSGGFNSVRLPWSNELVETNPLTLFGI